MEREGRSSKKKTFAARAWMVAMALIVSGCSLFNLGEAEVMDFDAAKKLAVARTPAGSSIGMSPWRGKDVHSKRRLLRSLHGWWQWL